MTYFGFLLRFLFIPVFIFLAITWLDNKKDKPTHGFANGRAVWVAILVHVVLAVVYTTPWDNYLVATSVWYYNPNLVTGIVFGYVPMEEYTFFVIETILSGLWWWFLVRRIPRPTEEFRPNGAFENIFAALVGIVWLIFTTIFFSGSKPFIYLSITLFWALPAIFVQVLFGANILWHHRRLVVLGILVPSVYLSLIDMIALNSTTWSISTSQTTGILFFNILPLEEVVFFFVTNILIVFGLTLLLAHESSNKLRQIKKCLSKS